MSRVSNRHVFNVCDLFLRAGKACIKKILLGNCLQELMELHQVSLDEGLVKYNSVIKHK